MDETGSEITEKLPQDASQDSPEQFRKQFREKHPGLAASGATSLERFTKSVNTGREFIDKNPSASHLFEDGSPITEAEIFEAKKLLQNMVPVTIDNYQTYMQIHTTSRIAVGIAEHLKQSEPEKYKDLNPYLVGVNAVLQGTKDILRLGKFLRRDVTGKLVLQKLGIRDDILQHLPSVTQFMNKTLDESETSNSVVNTSIEKKIVQIASMVGQRSFNEKGLPDGIKGFDQALESYKSTLQSLAQPDNTLNKPTYQTEALAKYVEDWPSEVHSLNSQSIDFLSNYYTALHKFFLEKGIDFNVISQRFLENEANSPIKGIIFDIGGLAQETPQGEPVIAALSRMLELDKKIVENGLDGLISLYGKGFFSIESFWTALYSRFDRKPPSQADIELLNAVHADSLNASMDPNMKKVVKEAKQKGYIVAAHTTVGPGHLAKNNSGGIYDEFDLLLRTSLNIHAEKDKPATHLIIPTQLDLPPKAFLFIDDNQDNLNKAQEVGMHTALHVPGNDMKQELVQGGVSL